MGAVTEGGERKKQKGRKEKQEEQKTLAGGGGLFQGRALLQPYLLPQGSSPPGDGEKHPELIRCAEEHRSRSVMRVLNEASISPMVASPDAAAKVSEICR